MVGKLTSHHKGKSVCVCVCGLPVFRFALFFFIQILGSVCIFSMSCSSALHFFFVLLAIMTIFYATVHILYTSQLSIFFPPGFLRIYRNYFHLKKSFM